MNARPISRSEFFASIGRGAVSAARNAFRSRLGRVLFALLVAAASIGVAILIWNMRDLLAGLAAAGFIYLSPFIAWELLPFSEETRAKWARQEARRQELSDLYLSYRWRKSLWWGLGWMAMLLWKIYRGHHFEPNIFICPAVLMVVGIVAQCIWYTRHRDLERD